MSYYEYVSAQNFMFTKNTCESAFFLNQIICFCCVYYGQDVFMAKHIEKYDRTIKKKKINGYINYSYNRMTSVRTANYY